ncbi:MAG: Rab family GTPase [Promethearchaeota archaeon]
MPGADVTYKLCIFGDGGVGKTTLVNRYLTGLFKGDQTLTIGVEFHTKKVKINGKTINFQIWDFAGEKQFRFLLPSYVRGVTAGMFMYDITRYISLKNMQEWLETFKEGLKIDGQKFEDIPLIMVGGKLDLEYKRAVDRQEAIELAKKYDFEAFIETSAKTGQNVEIAFETLAKILLQKMGPLPK